MAFFSPFNKKKTTPMGPWYAFLLLGVLAVAFGLKIYAGLTPDPVAPTADVPSVSYEEIVNPEPTPEPETEPEMDPVPEPEPDPQVREPKALEAEMNLAVPFTSQAPYGVWDPLHEDACEEASFYMVHQFYSGTPEGKIDPAVADPELQRLVHAEEAIGLTPSITLAEAKDFLMKDSNTTAVIIDNPTVGDIKQLIAQGKPIIVPAAGRELGNPFFTGEGPLYHMLVIRGYIRGYTETTFITNDPGTRMGENYVYDIDVLMAAIGDWNDGDPANGAKRIMYLDPK
jgi:hypothetical protein